MKRILIPTDFTIASLQLVEYAILNFPDTKLEIILIAGYRLPEARWAMAHFSPSEQIQKQLSDEFIDSKRRLAIEHKKHISQISFEVFTGFNSLAFQNFLGQLEIDDALIPKDNLLHYPNKKWFDTTTYIKKNISQVIEVPLEHAEIQSQKKFSLISLFNL